MGRSVEQASPLLTEQQGEDKKEEQKVDNEEKLGEWWDEEDYEDENVPELFDEDAEDEEKLPKLVDEDELVKLLWAKPKRPLGWDGCAADEQTNGHVPSLLHRILYKRGWSCAHLFFEESKNFGHKAYISNKTKCIVDR